MSDITNQSALQLYYCLENNSQDESISTQEQIKFHLENLLEVEFEFERKNKFFKKYGNLPKYFNSLQTLTLNFRQKTEISDIVLDQLFQGIVVLRDLKNLKLNIEQNSIINSYVARQLIYDSLTLTTLQSLQIHAIQNFDEPSILGKNLRKFLNLQSLDLSFGKNNNSESLVSEIGIGLLNLTQLTSLQLSFCIESILPNTIQKLLQGCAASQQSLTQFKLHLIDHILIQSTFKHMTECLLCLQKLEKLSLAFNVGSQVESEDVISLMKSLSEKKYLKDLAFNIGKNKYGYQLGLEFGEILLHQKNLTSLIYRNLQSDDRFPFKQQFYYSPTFSTIPYNAPQQQGMQQSLKELTHLEKLSIEVDCLYNLGVGGLENFGQSLQNLKSLKELQFIFYDESDYYIEASESLGKNFSSNMKQLTSLSFQIIHKEITNFIGLDRFCLNLQELTNLTSLDLKFDQLKVNPEGIQSLGETIQKLNKVSILKLSLRNSNLGQKGITNLYQYLKSMKNLKHIEFDIKEMFAQVLYKLIQDLSLENFKLSDMEVAKKFGFINENQQQQVIEFGLGHQSKYLNCIEVQGIMDSLNHFKNLMSLTLSFPKTILSKQEAAIILSGIVQLSHLYHFSFQFAVSISQEEQALRILFKGFSQIKLQTIQYNNKMIWDLHKLLMRHNKFLVKYYNSEYSYFY